MSVDRSQQSELPITYVLRILKVLIFIISHSIVVHSKQLWYLIFGKPEKNIAGQLALITGGGGGLGRSIAIELAKKQCNVAIVDINLKAALKVVEEVQKFNVKAKAYEVDISKYENVMKLAHDVEHDLGPIDILINNAAVLTRGPFIETSSKDVENTINVNLLSYIWTVRVFLSSMVKRRKGHIVAISSIAGFSGIPLGSIYSATKFGVNGFMESLASELLYFNYDFIKTTTICPYFMSTRQDLMEYLDEHKSLHYLPAYTPDAAAINVVSSILREDIRITIPSAMKTALLFKRFQPIETEIMTTSLMSANKL